MHISQFVYAVVTVLIGINIQSVCCNPLEEKTIQKEVNTDELAKLRTLLIKLARQNELESFLEETFGTVEQDEASSSSLSQLGDELETTNEAGDQLDNDGGFDKRSSAYLRFGRSPAYLRFGRSGAYLRFGKRQPASYLRFGKRNPAYLRFGRSVE